MCKERQVKQNHLQRSEHNFDVKHLGIMQTSFIYNAATDLLIHIGKNVPNDNFPVKNAFLIGEFGTYLSQIMRETCIKICLVLNIVIY